MSSAAQEESPTGPPGRDNCVASPSASPSASFAHPKEDQSRSSGPIAVVPVNYVDQPSKMEFKDDSEWVFCTHGRLASRLTPVASSLLDSPHRLTNSPRHVASTEELDARQLRDFVAGRFQCRLTGRFLFHQCASPPIVACFVLSCSNLC